MRREETSFARRTSCEQLIDQCTRGPERVCLTLLHAGQADRPVSYRELMQAAAGYADALEKAGIQPGEVVILILPHGLDLIGAFWGAVLHGAIPTIMPFLTEKLLPERYRRDLAALVSVTRPAAVVTYPEFAAEVRAAVMAPEHGLPCPPRPAAPEHGLPCPPRPAAPEHGLPCPPLLRNEVPPAPKLRRHRVTASPRRRVSPPPSSVPAVLLCSDVRPILEPRLERMGGRRRAPQEIVFLQHSSGTTGLQKGVAITHRALRGQLESYGQAIRLSAQDVIVSWLPLYHDMGLITGFLMPILMGAPLVLMSPFDWVRDPASLLRAVTQYRGTLSWLPNFAYNYCAQKIRDSQLEGIDLSSWRAVINCSEPMFAQSFRLFTGRFAPYGLRAEALATSYAMAENVFGVTQGGIDGPVTVDEIDVIALQEERVARPAGTGTPGDGRPGRERPTMNMLSCGRPIPGTRVKVVNAQGQPLAERAVGELAVQSNCMLAGYYNRPDETARALVDGWYLTGDYGYIADGEVYVTGRKKDLIIVGGRNIFPQDIEAVANEVPGVHPGRSVAFGIYNEALGTEDAALVAEVDLPEEQICEDEACLVIEDALRLAVNQNTAVALRYIKLVGPHWLIKTSSGKIARAANREKFIAEAGGRSEK